MIELPLIFVAGFLGSSHCIGMCGPFAILVGSHQATWQRAVHRQLIYSAGRLFTYVMLGVVAGHFGMQLADRAPTLISVPAALSLLAGCFLVYQGLTTAGVLHIRRAGQAGPCLAGGLLGGFLRRTDRTSTFLAGLFTGFLPCGLVYGFLATAASTRDLTYGALTMMAFGLGTIPIMVATGIGGGWLSNTSRARMLRVAAWCVVLVGVLSIARGASYLTAESGEVPPCPFCD